MPGKKKQIPSNIPEQASVLAKKSRKHHGPSSAPPTGGAGAAAPFRYPDLNFALLPRRDVFAYQLQELHPGVFVLDDIFSAAECEQLRNACGPFLESVNPKNSPPKKGEAFRNNERFLSEDGKANAIFAANLWRQRLRPILLSEKNQNLLRVLPEDRQRVPVEGRQGGRGVQVIV